MNRSKVEWIREFLITQMNHSVVIYMIFAFLSLFNSKQANLFPWMILGLLPFLYYVLRKAIHRFAVFSVIHLCLPVGALCLPMESSVGKVLLFLTVAGYSAVSFHLKLNEQDGLDEALPPGVVIGVGFISYLIQDSRHSDWSRQYVFLILFFMICYFLYYFLNQYLQFLSYNAGTAANIPERAILQSGMRQVGIFSCGSLFLMLLLGNITWAEGLAGFLKKGLIAIIRLIFSGYVPSETEQTLQDTAEIAEDGMVLPQGETALVWIILEKIALVVFAAGLAVGIILGTWKLISYIRERFNAGENVAAKEAHDEEKDIRESIIIERRQHNRKNILHLLSNEEKIRKKYKKIVLNKIKEQNREKEREMLNYRTAGECCREMEEPVLQQIYEKARYSNEGCNTEDMKQIRRIK